MKIKESKIREWIEELEVNNTNVVIKEMKELKNGKLIKDEM